jgi:hypothetical protein
MILSYDKRSRDGESLYGRRWATPARALEDADEWTVQYLKAGGVLIASTDARQCIAARPASSRLARSTSSSTNNGLNTTRASSCSSSVPRVSSSE